MADNNENGGGGRGQRPACAACKHQRKSCPPTCDFRRNFPASMESDFVSVQKTFGIANVKRMLKQAETPEEEDEIARSLYWEARCWHEDAKRGPYGRFRMLQQQLEDAAARANHVPNNQFDHHHGHPPAVHEVVPAEDAPQANPVVAPLLSNGLNQFDHNSMDPSVMGFFEEEKKSDAQAWAKFCQKLTNLKFPADDHRCFELAQVNHSNQAITPAFGSSSFSTDHDMLQVWPILDINQEQINMRQWRDSQVLHPGPILPETYNNNNNNNQAIAATSTAAMPPDYFNVNDADQNLQSTTHQSFVQF